MPFVLDRLAIHKTPDVCVKAAVLFLDYQVSLGVFDCRINLLPVVDDVDVLQKLFNLCFVIDGDFGWVEVVEGLAVIPSFTKNCYPAQAGLSTIEDQVFEKAAVITLWRSPF